MTDVTPSPGPRWGRLLVTGATGFIGRHLVASLVSGGVEVSALLRADRDDPGFPAGVGRCHADLDDLPEVLRVLEELRPRTVLHLATRYAIAPEPGEIARMVDTNVLGTMSLLEAARRAGVGRFVNTSSFFVYRPSRAPVREDDPLEPLDVYALTKVQAEEACTHYSRSSGMTIATLRLFAPYGPGDHRRKLIPSVIERCLDGEPLRLTSGVQAWDFTHVEDIVEAYLRVLDAPLPGAAHTVLNIGTGRAVSVRQVVERIQELTRSRSRADWGALPNRPREVYYMASDSGRARDLLGWAPRHGILEDGLATTVDWVRGSRT